MKTLLTKDDMYAGLKILVSDEGEMVEATVIGWDPYEDKWVMATPEWTLGISHLEEDDYVNMEIKSV